MCDRIAIIDHGTLLAIGTPDELKQTYGGHVVELELARPSQSLAALRALPGIKEVNAEDARLKITTQAGDNVVPQIINLVTQDGQLKGITVREPNLDEVFLHLTGKALRD